MPRPRRSRPLPDRRLPTGPGGSANDLWSPDRRGRAHPRLDLTPTFMQRKSEMKAS